MLDGIDWGVLIWLIAAALSGLGEMLTGTLFLLPFVIGAIAAAVVAALGAEMIWTLAAFGVVTSLVFAWVFFFAVRFRAEPNATREGAGRYVGALGTVTDSIDDLSAGRVKLRSESWRAVTDTGEPIEVGVKVQVIEVRGNALVVKPV